MADNRQLFSTEFLANQVYWEQPVSFNAVPPQRIGMVSAAQAKATMGLPSPGKQIETGVFRQPSGDLLLKIYAPGIDRVEVNLLAMEPRPRIVLEKQFDGMHTGIFAFDPAFCGPMSTDIYFDGTLLIYPYIPVFWHRDRPVNFIEIPDTETEYIHIKDVPHGTYSRELFWSGIFKRWQRCMVYTPPAYQDGGEYPVLYLQAGGGENEITWEYNGRVTHIIDNLLAEGKCVPFILVTCDGSVKYTEDQGRGSAIRGFKDMLINDVIPFIESRYHVKKGKWNRAIAGLSRGAHQTASIGIPHPELFAYLGIFSGYMSLENEPGGSKEETAILRDPERFAKEYKVVFRCMGANDHLLPHFLEDNKKFEEYGLDKQSNYHYMLYPNQKHLWGAWRRAIYDFAQLIFK